MSSTFRKQQLELLKQVYGAKQLEKLATKHGTPLLIFNKNILRERYRHLCKTMPAVTPHFAIKSCPMPEVLAAFKAMSAYLDVATQGEIALLKDIDYPPELLIHTHPHKRPEDIKAAFDYGIRTFVLDSSSEIPVLEPYKNDIKLLVRLGFSSAHADIDLSYKFGLDVTEAKAIIKSLLRQGFSVDGVSFHVGSQTSSPTPYVTALQTTATFFEDIKHELKHDLRVLDIGGGFAAPYIEAVTSIEDYAAQINPLLEQHFKGVQVISEPGRYLINPAVTLLTSVVSRSKRSARDWLFLDDGVYGSFADMISGHMRYAIFSLDELTGAAANKPFVLAGPTCDSIDIMEENALLSDVGRDSVLVIPNIGAYSYALTTAFNSIPRPNVVVI